jgi:hypothetical protein
MGKIKCTCNPKRRGCSHYSAGKCRLTGNSSNFYLAPCIMKSNSYHYACCIVYLKLGKEWERRRKEERANRH